LVEHRLSRSIDIGQVRQLVSFFEAEEHQPAHHPGSAAHPDVSLAGMALLSTPLAFSRLPFIVSFALV